jgi:hypothetical protein
VCHKPPLKRENGLAERSCKNNKTANKSQKGYDLITGQILKKLPRKAIIKITHIINATIKMRYVPGIRKKAEVLLILKPGKPPNKVD